jgi:hypothetical protein
MLSRVKLTHPALKHGVYSSLAVLPGEDRAEFEKIHRQLIAAYSPADPLQDYCVSMLARLIWRTENLSTFALAKTAREPFIAEGSGGFYTVKSRNLEEIQAAQCAATVKDQQEEARQQLGQLYPLVAIGETATISHLEREMDLRERLNELIAKYVKQLLLAKGLKSISPVRSVSGPSKGA